MKTPRAIVREMFANFDVSRSSWFGPSYNALRSMFVEAFFHKPLYQGSTVNFDKARALYRNSDEDFLFGGGFVRPIIDLQVEYMGVPSVSGTTNDAFLNECITNYWAPQIQEALRDAIRDSKVIVRYRQPSILNPLFTESDRSHGKLELLPPESVEITYASDDPDMIERAVVTHFVKIDERTEEEIVAGTAPREEEHEVLEIITRDKYTFYDKTAGKYLESWSVNNTWKFVPLWTMYNEYAADLGGGQSDIEPILTFIQAFHDVMEQTLAAHKYHSTPKAKFNIKDVRQFIKNNWPESLDETGNIKQGAKINWSGKEILFFAPEEDGDFMEAVSVLGDSKTLLEFLIDCIAIAAETPRWALLADTNNTSENDASVQPFVKKIDRKRLCFQDSFVMICKMALVANGKRPETPRLSWPHVRLMDLVSKGQAIQQLILGFDVATQHRWMSDRTVVSIMASLFEEIGDPDQEMKDAQDNLDVAPAPAPPSDTQGLPPTNGKVDKQTAKKALATTGASNS